MYATIRKLLFTLPPEQAHRLTLNVLNVLPKALFSQPNNTPVELMGLSFRNRLGLSAGVDNNGDYINALAKLGFGFIEVGGVTPKPQPGNPKPRIYRLVDDEAIINRMGFPNKGVMHLKNNIRRANYDGVLGVNVAKNKETSLNDAVNDYAYCIDALYKDVSYFTINVSSPNTPGLRELQHVGYLNDLFKALKEQRDRLCAKYKRYVPLLVKLTVDMADEDLKETVACLHELDVDGFVFSNTTLERGGLTINPNEQGGLSGKPLFERSTTSIRLLREITDKTIIGVGGVSSAQQAEQKIAQGADLVQLYTGLIYRGPGIVTEIANALDKV